MLIVEYLVKVGYEELTPGNEVEDVKFFSVGELPDYYVGLFSNIIEVMQKQG